MNVATALAARIEPAPVGAAARHGLDQAALIDSAINDSGDHEMTKLVYGKKEQVEFLDETEKNEAFDYLISSKDVEFYHEQNQESGAWASEKRIYFYSEAGVPEGLKRNWTAGRGSNVVGRINCAELYDEVQPLREAHGS